MTETLKKLLIMTILIIAVIIMALSELISTVLHVIGFNKDKEIMFLTDTINNLNKEIAVRDHNITEVNKRNSELNNKVRELYEHCMMLEKLLKKDSNE